MISTGKKRVLESAAKYHADFSPNRFAVQENRRFGAFLEKSDILRRDVELQDYLVELCHGKEDRAYARNFADLEADVGHGSRRRGEDKSCAARLLKLHLGNIQLSLRLVDILLGNAALCLDFLHAVQGLFEQLDLRLCLLIARIVSGKRKFGENLVFLDVRTDLNVDFRNRVGHLGDGACLLGTFDGAVEIRKSARFSSLAVTMRTGLPFCAWISSIVREGFLVSFSVLQPAKTIARAARAIIRVVFSCFIESS